MRPAFITIALVAATFWCAGILVAGDTGKISGKITEKKDGTPVVGANVLVLGTKYGATTDIDGEYFVLRVPPGTYRLRISSLGHQEIIVQNVVVTADLTTRINMGMTEQAIEIDKEIVVTAVRPVIQKDATASTQFIDAEQIARLPVQDAREGVFLQAGVFFDPIPVLGGLGSAGRGEPRYSIRGGSQEEIKWFIDGVRTAALIEGRADRGGSFTNVNANAVQEIQIQTSGYSAEFGDAQSGIVNVITKEGGSRFSGSAEYIYGFAGQHHFGNYAYDRQTEKEFLDHTLPDGSLDPAWWTPYRQSQVYDYRKIPDHVAYLSLGGPVYEGDGHSASFFVSSALKREAYALPHPRDTRNLENVMGNIAWQLPSSMKLKLNFLYNHEGHSTLQETADFTEQAKYYRGWGTLLDTYTYNASLHFTHTLSPSMFYDAKLSWYLFDSRERPPGFATPGESTNPDIWGYQRYDGYPSEPYDEFAPFIRNHLQTGDLSFTGTFDWQINPSNLLKAGLEARSLTVREMEGYRFPSFSLLPDEWLNRGLHETYHPVQLAVYIQHKVEFESMILNLGVRWDYFDPNRTWFYNNTLFNLAIDPEYSQAADPDRDQLDSLGHVKYSFENVLKKPRTPAPSLKSLSPRIGISFPITDKTVLRFNYGHFYQIPPLDRMFEFNYFRPVYIVKGLISQKQNPSIAHVASNDGDPERVVSQTLDPLKPEKTISFEVGVKHNFDDIVVLDVTGFYKDVTDQTDARVGLFDRRVYGYNPFLGTITPNVFYVSSVPGDYGDARGFEVSLRTLFSTVYALDVNYSFSRSTQGRASPGQIIINQNGGRSYVWDTDVTKRIPVERTFSRPHVLRANLYVRYPADAAPSLLTTLLNRSTLSILYKMVSGQAFTYVGPSDPPDTYDNYRYPITHTVDLRIEKGIELFGASFLTAYLRVTNLLNTKNLRSYGDIYFDVNATKDYVEKGKISTVDGAGYDISWQTWYEPRRFYMGVRYDF
jgi:hypothetical protein